MISYIISSVFGFSDCQMRERLIGKVALVTGASSGIGKELAILLHRLGVRLILAARNEERLNQLKQELIDTQVPGSLEPHCLSLDLQKLDTLAHRAKDALELSGTIDILVNNGGISVRGRALDTELEVHKRVMDINYFGGLELTRHIVPHMVEKGSGMVVNISSVQGRLAIPYRAAYTASKHALQAWSDSLRAELLGTGVEVLVVSPGYVKTGLSVNALTAKGDSYGQLDSTTELGYSPIYVAHQIAQGMSSQKKEMILAPMLHRLALIIRVLWPQLYFYIMTRRARKLT